MKLLNYYFDDINKYLFIEFSTKEDGDDFYRELEIDSVTIEYYSPIIVEDYDLANIDDDFIIELLYQYLKENTPPEQLVL